MTIDDDGPMTKALLAYLAVPRDDETHWESTSVELERQINAAMDTGNPLQMKTATAIAIVKERVDERRRLASLARRN